MGGGGWVVGGGVWGGGVEGWGWGGVCGGGGGKKTYFTCATINGVAVLLTSD